MAVVHRTTPAPYGLGHNGSRGPISLVTGALIAIAVGLWTGAPLSAREARVVPPPVESPFEQIRTDDLKFAQLGYRLATANVKLCDRREPATGIVFHSLSSYAPADRAAIITGFGFETDIGVEAVIPGSPAEAAGIVAGDSLVSIKGAKIVTRLPPAYRKAATTWVALVNSAIAELSPDAPMELTLRRGGQERQVTLKPIPACRSRFELLLGGGMGALSDGVLVQIGSRIVQRYGEASVGVIAHELAHNILRHRARMDAQGIGSGLRAAIGPGVPYYRRTETEADIVSVYLVVNAGFDVQPALEVWTAIGRAFGSPLIDRSHPRWQDRVATMEKAALAIKADPAAFHVPPLLVTRDQPVSKDWAAILVRAKP